jgi:hypothetical protein
VTGTLGEVRGVVVSLVSVDIERIDLATVRDAGFIVLWDGNRG